MPIKLPFRPRRESYPPDLWTQCPSCEEMLFNKQLDKLARVCPSCGHHFRLSAQARIEQLADAGTFTEHDAGLESVDPLGFVDQKPYPDRIDAAQLATGLRDAATWGEARIDGTRIALVVMDFGFMGGSMGAVVGEKIARAAEFALQERIPLVTVSASGGARMQEGTLALMQLAKTVAAVERLREASVPFVSVLSDPTTGGVFASFSALGDVNLAEPNALIGFAGARVAAGTIAAELPPGFQRAEFLFEHGFVDRVVHRNALRDEIAALLAFLRAPAVASDGAAAGGRRIPLFAPLVDRVLTDPAGGSAGGPSTTAAPGSPGSSAGKGSRTNGTGRSGQAGATRTPSARAASASAATGAPTAGDPPTTAAATPPAASAGNGSSPEAVGSTTAKPGGRRRG